MFTVPPFTARVGVALLLAALPLLSPLAGAGEAQPAARVEPRARTIVLLRHGQYDEHDPKADPEKGASLTPLGIAQARLAGARLSGWPGRFDAVLASPLTRAQETARVVSQEFGLNAEVVEALAECTPPTWRTAVVADEKPEDLAACARKLDRVFAERFRPAPGQERRELLVCHGNVIRYLVTRALGVDTKAWLEMSIGHASLTTVRVAPDGTFRVIAVGDVGHLPPSLLTGASGDPERALAVPAP